MISLHSIENTNRYTKFINYFFPLILGDITTTTYQERILKLFVFLSTIYYLISVIFNYLVHNDYYINLSGSVVSILFILLYIYSRFNFNYLRVLYLQLILSLVTIVLSWAFFDGYDGIVYFICLLLIMGFSLIARGIHSYIILSSILGLVVSLTMIEYYNPEIVINYKNSDARFSDLLSTGIMTILFAFIVLKFVFNKFLTSRGVLQENVLLEEKNKIILDQNDKLEKLNATKDKFFSIIAHDLRNPLGNFQNISHYISESYDQLTEIERKNFLLLLDNSSKQVFLLLENLLAWSQSQRGLIDYNPEFYDFYEIVASNFEQIKSISSNKLIKIKANIEKGLYVRADINMLNTILRNLIINAIKFTKSGGEIEVGAKTNSNHPGFVTCYVKDNGIGMSKTLIRSIFADIIPNSSIGTAMESGSGLGIMLCKEFINYHNGELWVESELGKGSTFYFTIPEFKK